MTDDARTLGPAGSPEAGHKARAGMLWVRCWLWLEAAWADFLYLVFPTECLVCGVQDAALCPDCARALRRQTRHPYRAESGADALMDMAGTALLPAVAAGDYRDVLSTAVLAFKNHGRTELAPQLAACLGRALEDAVGTVGSVGGVGAVGPESGIDPGSGPPGRLLVLPVLLVPVPGSGAGWRRRGYNPVQLLLAALKRRTGLPAGTVVAPVLRLRWRPP